MKKKIYIAGKVTGEKMAECTMKFGRAQKQLEAAGFEAVNPLELVGTWDITWNKAMRICIKGLMDCDGVYMLPCATKSPGANIEINLAGSLAMPIATQIKTLQDTWNK